MKSKAWCFSEILFLCDPVNIDNLIPFSFALSKSSLYIWSSQFTSSWSLAWRIFEYYLASMEMSTIIWLFEHSLESSFFGIGMKTDLFQSCGHCWVFQICWHIECCTLTASSYSLLNSSAGIPSSPLALFMVMLPKVHLTSHSRISDSKWVNISLWLYRH